MALTLGVSASAVTKYVTGTSGYKLTFAINAGISILSGAAYNLVVSVSEVGTRSYYYPYIYIFCVLYGKNSTNSTNSTTVKNTYYGSVSASRDVGDCAGRGYGEFRAYGNSAYGDVYGSTPV